MLVDRRSTSRSVFPRWPVMVALGLVTLLIVGTLGVDLLVERRVARRTAEIVENTQRSVELVDELRAEAHRLIDADADPNIDGRELVEISERVEADARTFDPLANSKGEREEWLHLQSLLSRLRRTVAVHGPNPLGTLPREIGSSMDRLVVINREAAHTQAAGIANVHRRAIEFDASVGALTVALLCAIAFVLLRVLSRQRTLVADYIALVEERNRELDAFADRAAHDLRSPLNPIRGYSDLLLTGQESPDEVRTMAARIRVAVDRMTRVIDDMLELSRAGRPPEGEASPDQVCTEILEELEPDLRGAELKTDLTQERVRCAPGVLGQLIRNLVGNALKFRSRQRPLVLEIRAEPRDESIEIVVVDNGLGMDEESAVHAFEPYYRGRTDREVPGHGLGLAIVERTVRALGGTSSLTSAPDRGTRVVLRLPRPLPARQLIAARR